MAIEIPDIPAPPDMPSTEFLDKLKQLQVPSQSEFINTLSSLQPVPAMLMLMFGIISLLLGWKIFKALVVANAAYFGGLLGAHLGNLIHAEGGSMWLFGMIAGGLLTAVLAWPMMKYAVSALGGLAGSFLGYGTWHYVANLTGRSDLTQNAWAGALVGLVGLGLLAFVIFKFVVMTFTAIEGALLTVSGALALLLQSEAFGEKVRRSITGNSHLLPLLIILPAVVGFALQYNAVHRITLKKQGSSEAVKAA